MKLFKNTKVTPIVGLVIGVVIGFIFSRLTTVNAGNLEPTAPPGPTMKTLDQIEPRIPIPASLTPAGEFTITNPGCYYLAGNRCCSGNGIVIQCNDVTIDLMGYNLIGPGSGTNHGIFLSTYSNIEVRNGTIRNFGYYGVGQESVGARGNRIINIRALSNGKHGIRLEGKGHSIKDCTSADNGDAGIATMWGSSIIGNIVFGNSGVGITAGQYSSVIGNTVEANGFYGIYTGMACTIDSNTVAGNTNGVYAYRGSTVTNNTVGSNFNCGINLYGDNLVDQNTAVGNGDNIFAAGPCTYGVNHTP